MPLSKGRSKDFVSRTMTVAVSKATLGKLLRGGMKRTWAFPRAQVAYPEQGVTLVTKSQVKIGCPVVGIAQ